MQASQRTECNHALEYAILKANKLHKPLLVFFGIAENYPEANERHYYFMVEGLREVQSSLEEKGIKMVLWRRSPDLGVVELSKDACLTATDRGHLNILKKWRSYVANRIDCPLVRVESDVVVPVEVASPQEEYSAATFRPKIKRAIDRHLAPPEENYPKSDSSHIDIQSFNIEDIDKAISRLNINRSVKRARDFHGGTHNAKKHLELFLKNKLDRYPELRNDPTKDYVSNMSPYLHFGQISPLYIALKVLETDSLGKDAYLEELIIRRELSINFIHYNLNYSSFFGLPEWAKKL